VIYSVAFDPKCEMFASGAGDSKVNLWDARSGELLRRLDHGDYVLSTAFDPQGSTLACGVKFWEPSTGLLRGALGFRPLPTTKWTVELSFMPRS
jgi:WD40 repeat protein